jgi:UDP-N-acetyl-D-mannosaminuronic acid dehydrogenase
MSFNYFKKPIKTISVVGMGYVGVPSAVSFSLSDKIDNVYGIQRESSRSKNKINMLNNGENPFPEDREIGESLDKVIKANKFKCTSDYGVIENSDAITVCVQTPFRMVGDSDNYPDYSHVKDAIKSVAEHIQFGSLISIESTITPGSTDTWIKEDIEHISGLKASQDFYLVHAPERVAPGRSMHNIRYLSRCVGGIDKKSCIRGYELYSHVVNNPEKDIILMNSTEAEVTKTAENSVRDLQIATANQLALYCESMGINFDNVFRGIDSLTGYGVTRAMLHPGAGVGGHCLVKDGLHLEYGFENYKRGFSDIPNDFYSLFLNARSINDYMPIHMVTLTIHAMAELGKRIDDMKVAILGWAFAPNTSDDRNTPSYVYYSKMNKANEILRKVNKRAFDLYIHDPYVKVPSYEGIDVYNDLELVLNDADIITILTRHDDYTKLEPSVLKTMCGTEHPIIVDGRNTIDPDLFTVHGFIYRGVGRGDINFKKMR